MKKNKSKIKILSKKILRRITKINTEKVVTFLLLFTTIFHSFFLPTKGQTDDRVVGVAQYTEVFLPSQSLTVTSTTTIGSWENLTASQKLSGGSSDSFADFNIENSTYLNFESATAADSVINSVPPENQIPVQPQPVMTIQDVEVVPADLPQAPENETSTTTVEVMSTTTAEAISTTPSEETDTAKAPEIQPIVSLDISPSLEYSQFKTQASSIEGELSLLSADLKISLAGLENSGASLSVEYAVGTSTWQALGEINFEKQQSPEVNNGPFVFTLPKATLEFLNDLAVRLVYKGSPTQSPPVYIKSLWVEANYENYFSEDNSNNASLPESLATSTFSSLEFQNQLLDLTMPGDLTNPISLGRKGSTPFVMGIENVSKDAEPEKNGNQILYQNAFAFTDLEYNLKEHGLKENIILKKRNHPKVFKYIIDADSYDIKQASPNVIELYKKGRLGQPLFKQYTLSAPLMTDADLNVSNDLVFSLTGNILTLTPNSAWLKTAVYPVVVDPTIDINILNVSSFPVAGEQWTIDFTTLGIDDLTVTAGDQETIDDMDFTSLTCDGLEVAPIVNTASGQVLARNWNCDGLGEIKFLDKKTGHHHMIFNFGGVVEDAYNGANIWNGNAGNNIWETPGNWSTGAAPTSADDVVISTSTTININSSTTVNSLTLGQSGGGRLTVLNFNYDAIASGSLTTIGDLTVYASSTITHTYDATTTLAKINLTVGGNAIVNGSISADGRGFTAGYGAGAGQADALGNSAGGSYGGAGSNSVDGTLAGSVYGSITAPTDIGSGGGFNCGGNFGTTGYGAGGAIKLQVTGTTTISSTGSMTANASSTGVAACWYGARGSGGSVYLITGNLTGSGRISANGTSGNGGTFTVSNSGGGRIAVYYTSDTSSLTYNNYGGSHSETGFGSGGTIYKKSFSQTYGDLIIDNNSIGGSDERLIAQTPLSSFIMDSLTLRNSGSAYLIASSATATTISLASNGLYNAKILTRLNYTTISAASASMVLDSGGTMPLMDENQDITIPTNLTLNVNTPGVARTYNNVTINGNLTHAYNAGASTTTLDANLYKINWTVTGNLTVNSGGSVNVDGRGYPENNGFGAGTPTSGAGGSYGGLGGTASYSASTTVAAIYGSSTAPTHLGSGGASGNSNSGLVYGGGAVKFSITGNMIINGSISANGTSANTNVANPEGGGSGGSIYLIGQALSGSGTMSSIGGDSFSSGCCANKGGGGGGGRIAVYLTNNTNNAVVRSASGGFLSLPTYSGATGTLYPPDQPTITTEDPTSIADTSVVGHGTLSAINYYPILQHGFVIGTSSNPTVSNAVSSSSLGTMSASGTYAGLLVGMAHDTNYHIRSYASTTGGLVYGNDIAFLTDAPAILTQVDYQFYRNNNLLQPASSIGGENIPINIYTTTTPIRIIMNLSASSDFLPAGVGQFKLQVSTATSTGWMDLGSSGGDWWNTSWLHRHKITLNNASSTTDLINFPILVSLNATTTGNIDYSKTKALGADIRFIGSDNSTLLSYEIEKWDTAATSTVWVKIPTLRATSTTDFIYIYYNNTSATDAQTATSVWDSSYHFVEHLKETSGTALGDSTSNGITATKFSAVLPTTTAAGKINGAQAFNGSSAYYTVSDALDPIAFTISAWIKASTTPATQNIFARSDGSGPTNAWSHQIRITSGNKLEAYTYDGANKTVTGSTSLTANNWYYVTAVASNSGSLKLYVNGVEEGTPASINTLWTGGDRYYVGSNSSGFNYFPGIIDEVRMSTTTRTSDWILAEYKTENGQMNTYAAEEAMSAVVLPAGFSFYSISGLASGTTVSSLLLSSSNVQETYEQSNPTAITPYEIPVGQFGEWDFSVLPANAVVNTAYYFRMIKSDGTALDFYSNYPTVTLLPDNVPNAPTSLGPSSVIGGGYITSRSPTFTFNLSDPDVSDTVQYEIQISTSSSFTGLITDYTSALQSQGAASFTMGQNPGSGSYSVGTSGQSLDDNASGYYWRVLTIDLHEVSSSYSTANSGAVAFKVDATAPVAGTLSVATTSTTSLTASVANATDTVSGLISIPYIFSNITAGTNSSATTSQSWFSSGLTPGTQYTFAVQVSDVAGNNATATTISIYTLANAPTALATTSISQTSITFSWNGNSNGPGTNYVLENITAGTSATTTSTSTVFSGLTCETTYSFKVKAINGNNISTAYSSTISETTQACTVVPVSSSESSNSASSGSGGSGLPTPSPVTSPIGQNFAEPFTFPIGGTDLPGNSFSLPGQSRPPVNSQQPIAQVPNSESIIVPAQEPVSQNNSPQSRAQGFSGFVKSLPQKTQEIIPLQFPGQELKAKIAAAVNAGLGMIIYGALSALNSQALIWNIGSWTDVWWIFLRAIYELLTIFGLRKKRRPWGTVYDSDNKQPLDPVLVHLIDAQTKKVLEQAITDITGRFGFLDKPGKYIIDVKKTHYSFPSQKITGTSDGIYDNLYHGGIIESSGGGVLTPNIPMDAQAFDWNQQDKQRIFKFHPRLEHALYIVLNGLLICGTIYSIMAVLAYPGIYNLILLTLFLVVLAGRLLQPGKKLWGQVVSPEKVYNLLLELSPKAIPQVVLGRAKTAPDGRFFLKAPAGEYILKISSADSKENLKTLEIKIGSDGVLNQKIVIG